MTKRGGVHFRVSLMVSGPITWRQVIGAIALILVLAAILVLVLA
jgi:hypothetical protein